MANTKNFGKKIIKFFIWCAKSLVIGLALVFIYNFIGSYVNLYIPINWLTILIVSLLKLPGLAAVVIFTLI